MPGSNRGCTRCWRVGSLFEAVIAKHRLQRAAGVADAGGYAATELKLQEGIGGALQIRTITIPPGFLAPRQVINVHVLGLHHFEQAGFTVRAAPAAVLATAVRSFGDGEVTDDVVDHHRARSQLGGDALAASGIAGPDAGGERELR